MLLEPLIYKAHGLVFFSQTNQTHKTYTKLLTIKCTVAIGLVGIGTNTSQSGSK